MLNKPRNTLYIEREGGREGGREGERQGGREGGREDDLYTQMYI